MLDTHAIARSLTAADFTPAQADALTDAFRPRLTGGAARRKPRVPMWMGEVSSLGVAAAASRPSAGHGGTPSDG